MADLNLLDGLVFFRKHARRILAWGFVLVIAGYAASFLIPPVYRAGATILPPEEDELSASLSLARRGIPGLTGLGRLGSYFTEADVALAILRSRSVHEAIVNRLHLRQVYRKKSMDDAVKELRNHVASKIATDGTIGVTVSDRDPVRAANIANAFLFELDLYNRTFRSTRGRRSREFLERRVAETDSLLRSNENALAAYQKRRGALVIPPEARGSLDAAANLMAQKAQAEIELEILRSYAAPQSEEVQALEERVRELRKQVGDLPATQVGGADLLRRVAMEQTLLALLSSQLEDARIREVMDTPTIQVLDAARPPDHRSWPRRSLIAGFGLLLGLGIGVADASGKLGSRRS